MMETVEGLLTTINIMISTKDKNDTKQGTKTTNGRKQQLGSRIENENDQRIEEVSFEYCPVCPNKNRIQIMQASLGKLCKNSTLDGITWTTEILKNSCKLI